jgi:hypothetical protein
LKGHAAAVPVQDAAIEIELECPKARETTGIDLGHRQGPAGTQILTPRPGQIAR